MTLLVVTRTVACAALLGLLAACGVDGAPTRPEPKSEPASSSGVTISGEFGIGIKK